MTRIMYDSVTPTDIPTTAQVVAGYVDGAYAWSDAGWRRFPSARKVTITVGSGTLDANVADVENGDYTPAQGAAWAKRKIAAGGFPWLYFSYSRFAEVAAAVHAQGIHDDQWAAWVALWDGKATLPPNVSMKQYANPTLSGHHYDLSIVADYLPGIDPAPQPAPAPAPAPVPAPPGPAPASASVDQVRLAFARLADALTHSFQAAITAIEQAKSDLANL